MPKDIIASVLIVDDDTTTLGFLGDFLKDEGYQVTTLSSSKKALLEIQKKSFDLILLDIVMPEMDGLTLLEAVKKLDTEAAVLIISGRASLENAITALRHGAIDYLVKPFNLDEVARALKNALTRRTTMNQNRQVTADLATKIENLERSKKLADELNDHLKQQLDMQSKELDLLHSIGQEMTKAVKLDSVLAEAVKSFSDTFHANIITIMLLDPANDKLTIKAKLGISDESATNTSIKVGDAISGWVTARSESLLIPSLDEDDRFKNRLEERYHVNSLMSVPISTKSKTTGVVTVSDHREGKHYDQNDLRFLQALISQLAIVIENIKTYQALQNVYLEVVNSLVGAIDAKDHYTRQHSENVTKYATAIAQEMNLSEKDTETLSEACRLHDLGKIGIHDAVLLKPSKLDPDEWEEMKSHSVKGAKILEPLIFMSDIATLVRQNHERFDGTGYPDGLKGDAIRLGARIMGLADAFDTMISERPYKKKMPLEVTLEEVRKNKGKQFDPQVVDAFFRVLEKNPEIIKE